MVFLCVLMHLKIAQSSENCRLLTGKQLASFMTRHNSCLTMELNFTNEKGAAHAAPFYLPHIPTLCVAQPVSQPCIHRRKKFTHQGIAIQSHIMGHIGRQKVHQQPELLY